MPSDERRSQATWGATARVPGTTAVHALGDLTLRLRREPDELWIHAAHGPERAPEAGDWVRWSVDAADALELRPALPDRPIVVSPEQPFFLAPHGRSRVFVRVPVFARLVRTDADRRESVLDEFPSIVLSDTWWGDFTDGELAYWVPTRARRAVTPDVFEPHLAVCPFLLVNEADDPLPVDRFAVRVAYLTLFGRGGAMWTDEVRVRYSGAEEGSEISYTGKVPRDAGDVDRLAPAREEAPRGLHARTFGRLKALSGGA